MDKEQLFNDLEKRLREGKMDRRDFLQATGKVALASLGLTIAASLKGGPVDAAPKFTAYPFTLGVASGDPWPDSVVLWTRLAPDPLNGGGMSGSDVPVKWEVASDDKFKKVVRDGVGYARAQLGHSVHIEVDGLKPNQVYYYRFLVGKEISPTGRTKTLPAYRSSRFENDVCCCFLPALRTRLLYGLPPYGRRRVGFCFPSGRLHLRIWTDCG